MVGDYESYRGIGTFAELRSGSVFAASWEGYVYLLQLLEGAWMSSVIHIWTRCFLYSLSHGGRVLAMLEKDRTWSRDAVNDLLRSEPWRLRLL